MNNKILPTDVALLQQMLIAQYEQNQFLQQNQQRLLEQITQLSAQLEKLQRLLFGQKSERRPRNNKGTEEEITSQAIIQTPFESSPPEQTTSSSVGRRTIPPHLLRMKIKYAIAESEQVCSCGGKLHCIGKEAYEQLDFVPIKLQVKEHIRYKYGCRLCQKITTAPMPEQPIAKGLAASGLLAEVLINKYQDALPLYRQEQRWLRLGYELPRSTLCDWVGQCAGRLKPIVEAMAKDTLLRSPKIHSDDTIVPVLAKGKTHKGRLWVYVGGAEHHPPCVIYRYTKTRSGKEPQTFLASYQGYLQADAYAGYDGLFKENKIIEVACFAHARRKFIDAAALVEEPTLADQAIDFIGQLYDIEQRAKTLTANQRYYLRRAQAKNILKRFYRWLIKYQPAAPPKSPLGQAMQYALNHWKALNNYLRDGILDIDNNRAERAIKPVVIGRKNYLFAGSHLGAENAAVIYSLIETCKALDINPFDYLKDVLERLPTTLAKNISDLFPYNWKPVTS